MGAMAPSRATASPVGDIQRGRLLTAMAAACADRSAGNVTVGDVVARARISRRTFYELFESCDDCMLATLDEALRRAGERVLAAWERQVHWQDGLRSGLEALLGFVDEDRAFGRLLLSAPFADWPLAQSDHLAEAIAAVLRAIDEGRSLSRAPAHLSETTAEGVLGAALFILHRRLSAGDSAPLSPLAGKLTAIIVMPYLGGAAAGRQLARPAPRRGGRARPAAGTNVLSGLRIRVTHRTVVVLQAIDSRPGASNHKVAQLAGIADQGQASRLLTRLARLGLIESPSIGAGMPHAWKLTALGVGAIQELGLQNGGPS
jgi:AcrR family transcriptional regulator